MCKWNGIAIKYLHVWVVLLFVYLFIYCDRPLCHWTKPMRLFVLGFPWCDVVDVKKSVSCNLQSKWNSCTNYSIFSTSASQTYQLLLISYSTGFILCMVSYTLCVKKLLPPPSVLQVLKSSRMRWSRPHNFGTNFAYNNLYIM